MSGNAIIMHCVCSYRVIRASYYPSITLTLISYLIVFRTLLLEWLDLIFAQIIFPGSSVFKCFVGLKYKYNSMKFDLPPNHIKGLSPWEVYICYYTFFRSSWSLRRESISDFRSEFALIRPLRVSCNLLLKLLQLSKVACKSPSMFNPEVVGFPPTNYKKVAGRWQKRYFFE